MSNTILTTVGDHIKSIRKELGLNQETFAANAGISVSYLSEIENGHKNPRISILYQICSGNNISADDLLFGRKNNPSIIDMIYDTVKEDINEHIKEVK